VKGVGVELAEVRPKRVVTLQVFRKVSNQHAVVDHLGCLQRRLNAAKN
jgi:hypothetical protein